MNAYYMPFPIFSVFLIFYLVSLDVTAASAGTYTCCVREKTPQCKAYVSYIINIIGK